MQLRWFWNDAPSWVLCTESCRKSVESATKPLADEAYSGAHAQVSDHRDTNTAETRINVLDLNWFDVTS